MPGGPIDRLHAWPAQRTLARSTAGSRVRHYNYFRSCSAERGRYTQADPIGLDGGFNRFGYVDGNPLRWTDPRGLAIPAVAACLANLVMCASVVGGTGLALIDACKKTWDALSPSFQNWTFSGSGIRLHRRIPATIQLRLLRVMSGREGPVVSRVTRMAIMSTRLLVKVSGPT